MDIRHVGDGLVYVCVGASLTQAESYGVQTWILDTSTMELTKIKMHDIATFYNCRSKVFPLEFLNAKLDRWYDLEPCFKKMLSLKVNPGLEDPIFIEAEPKATVQIVDECESEEALTKQEEDEWRAIPRRPSGRGRGSY